MTLPASITEERLSELKGLITSSGATTYDLLEVYTGEVITALPQSSADDVAKAYEQARAAQRGWAALPLAKRLDVMKRFHALMLANYETVVDLMQAETGKARRMSFEEVCDVVMTTSHYLKVAKRVLGEKKRGGVVPVASTSTEVRLPMGVIGIISPWNFPLATSISDAMPALIAGNAVVIKPDNKSTLCVAECVRLLYQAGLPAGLLQIVCGEGPDVGPALIDNADFVMFTGSTATGKYVGARAGENLIDCTLELGGKNPLIVMADANLDDTIAGATFGTYLNAGQACMHIERIYVPRAMKAEFTRRFVESAEKIQLGAAYDFGPTMGSLVSADQMNRVSAHVEDARAKGATVLTGGKARPDLGPAFYEPTVLTDVTPDMLHATEETFGPVVTIHAYDTIDEVVALANDTDYGLNASIWGTDLKAAERVGRRIESGNININDPLACSYASKATPSGGFKNSGVGARHGDEGLLKYTEIQHVAVLKKQVLGAPTDKPYEDHVASAIKGMRFMRKIRLR
ncbi:MAG: succinate-semialdehyde dehydrogenase / glutarate-semialdehyde dehydrogenase [Nocardioidaceae bacterium]|nr:succinate-semialdehyde dehydrogenase / glutarate-semialdehyde dehydrogenase [Nocardioidaceae bacterium]